MKSWIKLMQVWGAGAREIASDEEGQVMAEYTITFLVTVPLTCFFFHPDNGLFSAARQQFDLTVFVLSLPWG
ncbi:MAG: hypothetical protein HY299_14345 [Verrucomicrobia bacterium]|nr:hypothetical protein [Verrucomicrobiota bacterium]